MLRLNNSLPEPVQFLKNETTLIFLVGAAATSFIFLGAAATYLIGDPVLPLILTITVCSTMLWYMRRFLRAAQRKREDIDKFLSHTQRLVLEVAHPYASTGLIILACRQREEVLLYKTLRPLARDFGVHYVGQFLSSNVTDELDFEERDWLWSVLNNLGKRENNDETDDSLGGQAA